MFIKKEVVDTIVATASSPDEAIVDIFRLVFPEWERIQKINTYVPSGKPLWLYICSSMNDKFGQVGGLRWMNWGFTVDEQLGDWEVNTSSLDIMYKPL